MALISYMRRYVIVRASAEHNIYNKYTYPTRSWDFNLIELRTKNTSHINVTKRRVK